MKIYIVAQRTDLGAPGDVPYFETSSGFQEPVLRQEVGAEWLYQRLGSKTGFVGGFTDLPTAQAHRAALELQLGNSPYATFHVLEAEMPAWTEVVND